MRKAKVLYKGEGAGVLSQNDNGTFLFQYNDLWMRDNDKPAISLTLPKSIQEFHSDFLFPFFYNLLPEGSNKMVVCKYKQIDENDHFGLLLSAAQYDTIGAVTVHEMQESV